MLDIQDFTSTLSPAFPIGDSKSLHYLLLEQTKSDETMERSRGAVPVQDVLRGMEAQHEAVVMRMLKELDVAHRR
eukprot:CAMPEP_0184718294 /NCGR_PEP_ID=MMETSP0314-20130426/7537_1 /TAXON_ID=38298 /ORGANISM="Rhodella maculata, Strain CCMP 736" /LENGTH=74 /DNA_ID=CAMNT_0027182017 /DNA_START=336 /DNA_END=563 /DNA_ORIENTATION=-